MTMRRPRFAVPGAARVALGLAVATAVTGLLTTGMPPRSPDFVWRGPSGAQSPGPQAASVLRGVAHVLRAEYRLPLPSRLVARVYASRERFAHGLVLHAFVEPTRAAQLADFAAGVALPGGLLLRESTADPTPQWIRLVAHELTHVAQMELAGGETPAAQWISEGTAEWVAYGVVARTVPGALDAQRQRARPAWCKAVAAGPLGLAMLGDAETFVEVALRQGVVPMYHLAFVLVDDLVSRAGFAAVRAYFGSFRESTDGEANFMAAFGMRLGEFERRAVRGATATCARPSTSA